jgi:hypothetical protein
MGHQHLFNFPRIDIEPTADNYVLYRIELAFGNEEKVAITTFDKLLGSHNPLLRGHG